MPHKDKQKYNEYLREYMNKRYAIRRVLAVEKLGGKCIKCESIENLEFDHIDPKSKFKSIAKLSSASEKIFNEEISKCQLLCKSCHLEKSISEGSFKDKSTEKTCDLCNRVFYSQKSYSGHKTHCK